MDTSKYFVLHKDNKIYVKTTTYTKTRLKAVPLVHFGFILITQAMWSSSSTQLPLKVPTLLFNPEKLSSWMTRLDGLFVEDGLTQNDGLYPIFHRTIYKNSMN